MQVSIPYGTYNPSELREWVDRQESSPSPQPSNRDPVDSYQPSNNDDYWARRAHEPYHPYSGS